MEGGRLKVLKSKVRGGLSVIKRKGMGWAFRHNEKKKERGRAIRSKV